MAYADLREFITALEKEGLLKRVTVEVDWELEIGAIMRRLFDLGNAPAVVFEKIRGYPKGYSFLSGSLSTYGHFAVALGLPRDSSPAEITGTYKERIKNGIRPERISSAPCKGVKQFGDEVDLLKFPTPFWHQRDGGRYIGTFHCVAVKDPESDWVNVSLYRLMIHDKRHLGILMLKGQHANLIYSKYEALGKPMPIAITIGQDPVNVIAAYGSFDAGVCEWDMAGALRGVPVEMVKCETLDMLVPATAEIVIEGEVPPFERREEGPFGEYTGYYGGSRAPRPVVRVNCITHRENPITVGLLEGKPIQENNIMTAVQNSAYLEKVLIDDLNLNVDRVNVHPWAAAHGVIISMKPLYPGHVNRVASAIWATKLFRTHDYLIFVDRDIDPYDLNQVLWAICTRCKPDRDIITIPRSSGNALWPCLTPAERESGVGCKVIIDATFPAEWPAEWVPPISDWNDYPEEVRQRVEEKWPSYGLD